LSENFGIDEEGEFLLEEADTVMKNYSRKQALMKSQSMKGS
jgi:hypothetical protein